MLESRPTSCPPSRPWVARPSLRLTPRLACSAQARPFQPGSASNAEPRADLVSHALSTVLEAPAARRHGEQEQASTAQAPLVREPLPVEEQLRQLCALSEALQGAASYEDKAEVLLRWQPVASFLDSLPGGGQLLSNRLKAMSPKERYVMLCLPAIGQEHVLAHMPPGSPIDVACELKEVAGELCHVEEFYDALGGLVGYQRQCMQLICEARHVQQATQQQQQQQHGGAAAVGASTAIRASDVCSAGAPEFLVPEGVNLSDPAHSAHATRAALAGLAALPALAEVYPLGGAGDRLGLKCEATGDSLPTAVLQYCGRTLLEALIRDLQAREYLHWRVHGEQHTTPVAVMTSAAKGNHWRVKQAFEAAGWFGRGRNAFRLFQQPLVPMVSGEDGRWLLTAPLQLLMKPGGHGVIWKLMHDSGIFEWLHGLGRHAAIVRQISNPMAGQDNTLLALAGSGYEGRHSFGFASCERAVGAAEGINVLVRQAVHAPDGSPRYWEHRVTNVEYTEFERLGFTDQPTAAGGALSKYPANTNVLYVGLQAAEALVRDSVARGATDAILPGMILNLKKLVSFHDATLGAERAVAAGRLECTMQNLADSLVRRSSAPLEGAAAAAALDTYVVYNQRRKVTSSAKRKLKPGSTKVHQTPDGSFYDLQQNARELLLRCGFDVPEVGSVASYLDSGPGFIFLFHPALGPLWDVVAQKLRGGRLAPRCELVLEVAEAAVEGLDLQGSLLVHADSVMGHMEMSSLHPSPSTSHIVPSGSRQAPAGVRKVHNGVEHAPTDGGAYGAVAASGGGSSSSPPQQQQQHPFPAILEPRLVYSERCGRVRLSNVRVENRGVDWGHQDNVYWRHKVRRHESARIVLHGRSEFEARDVTLAGDLLFEVPDGHRLRVTAGPGGEQLAELQPLAGPGPSWRWRYMADAEAGVVLKLEEERAPELAAEPVPAA